ncbi:methyltransferase domain-containing protein [Sodalis sp. RH16]|uniref:methyltransferase domain-containing protein n=1 Tax=Sodalis sp. RH16 TaxID=3394331 RepID=UPI0039B67C9B
MIDDRFYFAFEERFRYSKAVIANRLPTYLPILQIFEGANRAPIAYDYSIECGEWLNLLASRGWDVRGVEINERTANRYIAKGMNVVIADALSHIKSIPDDSVSLISGFHLAECLSFEMLYDFVNEALRVLIPGGILIIETTQAEDFLVGLNHFYYDPAQIKPLPPTYLQFLVEYLNFKTTKIIGFHNSVISKPSALTTSSNCYTELSCYYSLVAQKDPAGADELNCSVADVIDKANKCESPPGYAVLGSLGEQPDIVNGWRGQIQERLFEVEKKHTAFEDDLSFLKRHNAHLSESVIRLYESAASSALHRAEDTNAELRSAQTLLHAIYASTSWKITKPLRSLATLVRGARRRLMAKGVVAPVADKREVVSDNDLTPHANLILMDLEFAIKQKKSAED